MSPAFCVHNQLESLILFFFIMFSDLFFHTIQPFQWFINEDMNKDTRETYNSLVDDCHP